jgi:hypothetical protein
MRQHLDAAEVAELAELFEDAPRRVGVVDEILQAAAEGRGMTLALDDRVTGGPTGSDQGVSRRAARSKAGSDVKRGQKR